MSTPLFQFSLSAIEVLELFRHFSEIEDHGPPLSAPLQLLKAHIINLASPASPTRFLGESSSRFSPYHAAATVHAEELPECRRCGLTQAQVNHCPRGGKKKIPPALHRWELSDEPYIERNVLAKEFLGNIMYGYNTNIHTQACLTWVSAMANSFQSYNAVWSHSVSLLSVVRKCSQIGNGTHRHLFTQALSQIEFSKVIDE
jgi:hypothetical protein